MYMALMRYCSSLFLIVLLHAYQDNVHLNIYFDHIITEQVCHHWIILIISNKVHNLLIRVEGKHISYIFTQQIRHEWIILIKNKFFITFECSKFKL